MLLIASSVDQTHVSAWRWCRSFSLQTLYRGKVTIGPGHVKACIWKIIFGSSRQAVQFSPRIKGTSMQMQSGTFFACFTVQVIFAVWPSWPWASSHSRDIEIIEWTQLDLWLWLTSIAWVKASMPVAAVRPAENLASKLCQTRWDLNEESLPPEAWLVAERTILRRSEFEGIFWSALCTWRGV